MKQPLASILVITYNQSDLIAETIQSCVDQTYTNVEIVVSDDGSTDNTPEILRGFASRFPGKIKLVLNVDNAGITANCNAGLRACTGEYMALMGGDDLLLPGKVARQVEEFLNAPDLVLSYHPCYVRRDGEDVMVIGDRPKDVVTSLVELVAGFGAQMPGPATMVRSAAIPTHGFDRNIGTASDWMFYIDVSSQGRVARLDETLAVYRQHAGNVGNTYFDYAEDFLKTLEIAKSRYRHVPGIVTAVRRGGRRFLLGIAYRALEQDRPELARSFARRLPEYSGRTLYRVVALMTRMPGAGFLLRSMRRTLKRYV